MAHLDICKRNATTKMNLKVEGIKDIPAVKSQCSGWRSTTMAAIGQKDEDIDTENGEIKLQISLVK